MPSATHAHFMRSSMDDRLSTYARSDAPSVCDSSSRRSISSSGSSKSSKSRRFMNMFRSEHREHRKPSLPAKNTCSEVEIRYLTLNAMAIGKL